MNKKYFLCVFVLVSSLALAGIERKKDGKAEADPGDGEVTTSVGKCSVRLKGAFDCPIEDRDPDIFVNVGTGLGDLVFTGKDLVETEISCPCVSPAGVNLGRWACDCVVPGSGTANFSYRISCHSSKTAITKEFEIAPKNIKVKCK